MRDSEFPTTKLISSQTQSFPAHGCTRCPICDKVFYVRSNKSWIYQFINRHGRTRFMCGWNCFRQAEKLHKASMKYKHVREEEML